MNHPEDFCQRCGGRNPVWWVDSDRYNTAVNRAEIVCPTCFVFARSPVVVDPPEHGRLCLTARPTPFVQVAL